MKKATRRAVALWAAFLLLTGCASYTPTDRPSFTSDNILNRHASTFKSESCEIQLVALSDSKLSKNYVGIDPAKTSMVPVMMKLTNVGKDPMKVDIVGSSIRTDSGRLFPAISIEEAIARARRSDAEVVGWTVAFGIVGAMVSGGNTAAKNRSLEEDYHHKSFKPSLINSSSWGEGLVFFDVPAAEQRHINSVVIQLMDVSSHQPRSVVVNL